MSNKYARKDEREMTPEMEELTYKQRYERLEKSFCGSMIRLLQSVGIRADRPSIGSYAPVYTHPSLHACRCRYRPEIEEDINARGTWLVICPNCQCRTESYPKVKDALKAWQDEKFTENSVMLMHKLERDEISDEGAKRLLQAMVADAAEEYVAGLKTHVDDQGQPTGEPSEDCRWFFSDSPGAVEAMRRRAKEELEEEKRKREEALRKQLKRERAHDGVASA